jgi:hypothetical protein
MSMKDHEQFLDAVTAYVGRHPEVSAYVADAVAAGLRPALNETRQRAADMEVALAMALAKRGRKDADKVILSKLSQWEGKTSLQWDDTIKMLKGELL